MPSMSSDWIDIQIRSSLDAGELLGRLDDPNVQGAWEDEGAIHLYWSSVHWSADNLLLLRRTLQEMSGSLAQDPEILVQSLPNQDWNRAWAQSVKPLWIGNRILIRPSWDTVIVPPDHIEIILDPKQAFGTGHHATTRMLLEWLEEIVCGGESILDVGTGSGLLAMVALRLGATRAVGIDNDPVAVECAQEYAKANRFGEELLLQCGSLQAEDMFDLVLANLDRQTLIRLAEPLAACTGGRLLLSGVLKDQREEIVDVFSRAALYPGQLREREGWMAMEFRRALSCEGGES